jgi:hypothetical protein
LHSLALSAARVISQAMLAGRGAAPAGGIVRVGALGGAGHCGSRRLFRSADIAATQSTKFLDLVLAALTWPLSADVPNVSTLAGAVPWGTDQRGDGTHRAALRARGGGPAGCPPRSSIRTLDGRPGARAAPVRAGMRSRR